MKTISSAAFRESLARFASGVTVVTAQLDEQRIGFTATAFTSVSLDPPLVLVCVAKQGRPHGALARADVFGVSVLAESQGWIAARFASRGVDRFVGVAVCQLSPAGPPLIGGALVQLVCRAHTRVDAGDHTVLVGQVHEARLGAGAGRPLIHFARRFGGFVAEPADQPQFTNPLASRATKSAIGSGNTSDDEHSAQPGTRWREPPCR